MELTDSKAIYIIEQFLYLMNNIGKVYGEHQEAIRIAELETLDLRHETEFIDFNAADGFKHYKREQEVLRRRRNHKNQKELLEIIHEYRRKNGASVDNLKSVISKIGSKRQEQSQRKYKARVLGDLRCGALDINK